MATDKQCKNQLDSPSPTQCMEHYGCIYENNHLVTLVVDPTNGCIVDANRAACEFYEYTIHEFRKLSISDLNIDQSACYESFISAAYPGGEYQGNQVFNERHQLASHKIIDVEIHTGRITMLGRSCIYTVIHDISERVRSELRLRESEERYRDLVELCPEAILVYSSGIILFANKQTEKMFGKAKNELLGQSIGDFFNEEYISIAEYNRIKVRESTKETFRIEQRFIRYDGHIFDLEISGVPIVYEEEKALQLVLRDITESKREIKRAMNLQERRHAVTFPLESKAVLDKLYIPATTLSGDFFIFQKISEDKVIGIIGDVTGKGLFAALNISALRVLISESLLVTHEPVQVLKDLNYKAIQHLGEEYIAVCCFLLDFHEGKLKAAGAGINEFIYVPKDHDSEWITIKGAPLGMFDNSEFDEATISFQSGDRFCFYSDGMELLFDRMELCGDYKYLLDKCENYSLQDDCTWLSLNIK